MQNVFGKNHDAANGVKKLPRSSLNIADPFLLQYIVLAKIVRNAKIFQKSGVMGKFDKIGGQVIPRPILNHTFSSRFKQNRR